MYARTHARTHATARVQHWGIAVFDVAPCAQEGQEVPSETHSDAVLFDELFGLDGGCRIDQSRFLVIVVVTSVHASIGGLSRAPSVLLRCSAGALRDRRPAEWWWQMIDVDVDVVVVVVLLLDSLFVVLVIFIKGCASSFFTLAATSLALLRGLRGGRRGCSPLRCSRPPLPPLLLLL